MTSIVIIGAGECGARAAFALRQKGFDGRVTLVGQEAALPYERPPLSKDALLHGLEPKFVAQETAYADAGIAVLAGAEAMAIERDKRIAVLADGTVLVYDRLLLATGARPRPFPGVAAGSPRIRTLRTHADAVAIRKFLEPGGTLAVVGGGFIGLELAATARKLGVAVTLLEGLPRILSRGVPEEIAEIVAHRHRDEGVEFLCGARIESIVDTGDKGLIKLDGGQSIEAGLIVVGIGSVPNTELAAAAGLAIDNGIAVDEQLRTSDPAIYAAGDCCSFPLEHYSGRRVRLEAWRNAQEQAALAAANLLGAGETVSAVPWFWSDQYDLTLQIAGLAEGAVETVRRDMGDSAFILFHLAGDGRLLAASGIGTGNVVARDIRLAEMLIAAGAKPDRESLASKEVKLKTLLAA